MEQLFRICGAAMLSLIALVLIKQERPEFVFPLRLAVGTVIFGAAFTLCGPILTYLRELAEGLPATEETAILFPALATAFLVQITAGICRENGEGNLASGVELAGRAVILTMCLPLLQKVFSLVEELMS